MTPVIEEAENRRAEMEGVVRTCHYPGYSFAVTIDSRHAVYLQGSYDELDTITRLPSTQLTRRWFLSPHMTKSEIVQTVFKCVLTSMEHRTREWFTYNGKPVFGPHFDVDALWKICERGLFEMRPEP